MAPRTIFQAVPDDLSALSVEDLNTLATELQDTARRVAANDVELLGVPGEKDSFGEEEILSAMTEGVTQLERIRAEIGGRDAAEQEFTGRVDELAAAFGIEDAPADEASAVEDDEAEAADDETPDDEAAADADTAAVETPEAPEATAAAVTPLRRPPAPRASHTARVPEDAADGTPQPAALVASGFADSVVRAGARLDKNDFLLAFGEGQRLIQASGKKKAVVASAQFDFPAERTLGNDADLNWQRIQQFAGIDAMGAILASGGFCAPYPPLYDLPIIATAERPVRAALPGFGAARGGIQFPTPLGLSDVIDGITVVTAAQDEAGGSDSIKNCVTIDCDPFQTAEVEAIAACVEHGNLNARAWPERVANVAQLLAAAHAQVAETELLAEMTALSTNVVDEAKYGAYSSLIQGVLKAAAAYRSRNRMSPDARLRAMFPAWVKDLIAADLAHNGFSRLEPGAVVGAVEGYLSRAGINVSWYIDQDGTTTQVYPVQAGSGAQLEEFFTHVVWYLFHEGAWIFLDMGRLDLGLVRDSRLNSTNDFNMFWETFEGAAMVGIESLRIDSTVCPNGATAAAATAFTCA